MDAMRRSAPASLLAGRRMRHPHILHRQSSSRSAVPGPGLPDQALTMHDVPTKMLAKIELGAARYAMPVHLVAFRRPFQTTPASLVQVAGQLRQAGGHAGAQIAILHELLHTIIPAEHQSAKDADNKPCCSIISLAEDHQHTSVKASVALQAGGRRPRLTAC